MQASAVAHPNVALIKYWGKRDTALNIPATGSLSLTLGGLETRTRVRFSAELEADTLLLNGRAETKAARGAARCLAELRAIAGAREYAAVESTNNFPTGAGLASSASGYAALVTAAAAALGLPADAADLINISRQGSGSAPRSLLAGIVVLEADAQQVQCRSIAAPEDWPLHTIVAVTSRAEKAVGSTEGMERSRNTSPFYQGWLDSHPPDMEAAVASVQQRDFERLAELAEHSCLKMHALAMSARPPLLYWNTATLAAMECVRGLRAQGVPVLFTIDAGPQLKAVCLPEASNTVRAALTECAGVLEVLDSPLGSGARVI